MQDETVYFRPKRVDALVDILSIGRDYFTLPVDDDERRKPSDIIQELKARGVRFDPHPTR